MGRVAAGRVRDAACAPCARVSGCVVSPLPAPALLVRAARSPGHRPTSLRSALSGASSSAICRWRARRAQSASSPPPFNASWDWAWWPRRGRRALLRAKGNRDRTTAVLRCVRLLVGGVLRVACCFQTRPAFRLPLLHALFVCLFVVVCAWSVSLAQGRSERIFLVCFLKSAYKRLHATKKHKRDHTHARVQARSTWKQTIDRRAGYGTLPTA